jgi:type VII secretion protein EccB
VASRQDQLHSYQFAVQRVVAAMVSRDADPIRSPTRRLAGAALGGVLVAALCLAAVAVYGVLRPGGGTGWRSQGAIVVEKETGARYVYLDGALHPVLNYPSALLLAGTATGGGVAGVRPVSVSRRSIEGVPRAARLGIPGAPDSLPGSDRLLGGAWTVCSAPATGSSLYIGQSGPGGRPLGGDDGLLVRAAPGDTSLIWHGHRHQLGEFALGALAWRDQPIVQVAPALLNAVPAGPPLAAPAVPGVGGASKASPASVGQVLVVHPQGGTPQYVVAVRDGLAAISQVQANLLLAEPEIAAVQGQPGAVELSPDAYTSAPRSAPLTPPTSELAPPLTMPALAHPSTVDGQVCASTTDARTVPAIGLDVLPVAAPAASGSTTVPAGTGGGADRVDRVLVPPGRGAVVEALAAPDSPNGALCLVTDLGVRYPLVNSNVLGLLGYAGVTPVRLPAGLVALLPSGRALDPDAARVPVPVDN